MLLYLCRHSTEIRTYNSLPELSSTKKEYLTTHCSNLIPLSAGKQYHPKSSVRKNKSGNVDRIKTWMTQQLLFNQNTGIVTMIPLVENASCYEYNLCT